MVNRCAAFTPTKKIHMQNVAASSDQRAHPLHRRSALSRLHGEHSQDDQQHREPHDGAVLASVLARGHLLHLTLEHTHRARDVIHLLLEPGHSKDSHSKYNHSEYSHSGWAGSPGGQGSELRRQ
eukprot:scaffold30614_cov63-Phaeocystis_antarctica.AAC.6